MVSQAQLTLDLIRTQLDTIRAKAVADEDQALTADQRHGQPGRHRRSHRGDRNACRHDDPGPADA